VFTIVDKYDNDKSMIDQRVAFFYYKGVESLEYLLEFYNDEDAYYLNEINSFIEQ